MCDVHKAIAELKRRKIIGTFAGFEVEGWRYYLHSSGAIMRIAVEHLRTTRPFPQLEREFAEVVEPAGGCSIDDLNCHRTGTTMLLPDGATFTPIQQPLTEEGFEAIAGRLGRGIAVQVREILAAACPAE